MTTSFRGIRHRLSLSLIILCLIATPESNAEVIKAYFEPFPPIITARGEGILGQLFTEIEQRSDFRFQINIATAHRIRTLIKHGDADLIGLFAISPPELNLIPTSVIPLAITFQVKNDIYATKAGNLEINTFKALPRIGVPYGNARFVADLVGISDNQVYQQNMDNLCKMLAAGRIDALTFERGAAMSCIEKHKLEKIHYRLHPQHPVIVGLLLQDTPQGRRLKDRLDAIIATIDLESKMKKYNYYLNLPDSGTVPCCTQ